MKKIINKPNEVVEDSLKGFLKANVEHVSYYKKNSRVVLSAYNYDKPKVGVVSGGGSGHKPAFIGYVGKNILDAVAVGEVFSSPPASAFYNAIKAADQGRGVACLYGNYAGDNMNVKIALNRIKKENIEVRTVVAKDDVASAKKGEEEKRRGVAGEILMWKIAGAKAAMGADLDYVINIAEKTINQTRSVGIGLSPCTIPDVGHPNFQIKSGKMEFGIGHHGEPGIEVLDMATSKVVAGKMLETILTDFQFSVKDEVVVLLSGLGSTPMQELYILYNDISDQLIENGILVRRSLVGNYFTSLEMGGATLTLLKLDAELKECFDYPVRCAAFTSI
mgnify:CR=1 FL=1